MDNANEKTLSVPADTPLAYNVCELYVKSDGAVELIIASGCRCVRVCMRASVQRLQACVWVCAYVYRLLSTFLF